MSFFIYQAKAVTKSLNNNWLKAGMLKTPIIVIIAISCVAVIGVLSWVIWHFVLSDKDSDEVVNGYRIKPAEGPKENPRAQPFTRILVSDKTKHHNYCNSGTAANDECKSPFVPAGKTVIVSYEGEYDGEVQFSFSHHGHGGPFLNIGQPVRARSTTWKTPTNVESTNCVIRVMDPSQPTHTAQSAPFSIQSSIELRGIGATEGEQVQIGDECTLVIQSAALGVVHNPTLLYSTDKESWTEFGTVHYESTTGKVSFQGLNAWLSRNLYFRVRIDDGRTFDTAYTVTFVNVEPALVGENGSAKTAYSPGEQCTIKHNISSDSLSLKYRIGSSTSLEILNATMDNSSGSTLHFIMPFPDVSTTISLVLVDDDDGSNYADFGPYSLTYSLQFVTPESAKTGDVHPEHTYYRMDYEGGKTTNTWQYEIPMEINGFEDSIWIDTTKWKFSYLPVSAAGQVIDDAVPFTVDAITYEHVSDNLYIATVTTKEWSFKDSTDVYVKFTAEHSLLSYSITTDYFVVIKKGNDPSGHGTPPVSGIDKVTVTPQNGDTVIRYGSPVVISYTGNYHGSVKVSVGPDGVSWHSMKTPTNNGGSTDTDQWRMVWVVNVPSRYGHVRIEDENGDVFESGRFDIFPAQSVLTLFKTQSPSLDTIQLQVGVPHTLYVTSTSTLPYMSMDLVDDEGLRLTTLVGQYKSDVRAKTIVYTPKSVGTANLRCYLRDLKGSTSTNVVAVEIVEKLAVTVGGSEFTFHGIGVALKDGRIMIPMEGFVSLRWTDTSVSTVSVAWSDSDGNSLAETRTGVQPGRTFRVKPSDTGNAVATITDTDNGANTTTVNVTFYHHAIFTDINAWAQKFPKEWHGAIFFNVPKETTNDILIHNLHRWTMTCVTSTGKTATITGQMSVRSFDKYYRVMILSLKGLPEENDAYTADVTFSYSGDDFAQISMTVRKPDVPLNSVWNDGTECDNCVQFPSTDKYASQLFVDRDEVNHV